MFEVYIRGAILQALLMAEGDPEDSYDEMIVVVVVVGMPSSIHEDKRILGSRVCHRCLDLDRTRRRRGILLCLLFLCLVVVVVVVL